MVFLNDMVRKDPEKLMEGVWKVINSVSSRPIFMYVSDCCCRLPFGRFRETVKNIMSCYYFAFVLCSRCVIICRQLSIASRFILLFKIALQIQVQDYKKTLLRTVLYREKPGSEKKVKQKLWLVT